MSQRAFTLSQLGWRPGYSQHLTLQDFEAGYPARVVGVHRNGLSVLSARGAGTVSLPHGLAAAAEPAVTVGDWLLVETDAPRVLRVIERQSLIARIAAGSEHRRQSIAANLDTLFVVTSCNEDFNLSRLERYLAVAFEAGVEPVVVLTKADLCGDVGTYVEAAHSIAPTIAPVAIDATSAASVDSLARGSPADRRWRSWVHLVSASRPWRTPSSVARRRPLAAFARTMGAAATPPRRARCSPCRPVRG